MNRLLPRLRVADSAMPSPQALAHVNGAVAAASILVVDDDDLCRARAESARLRQAAREAREAMLSLLEDEQLARATLQTALERLERAESYARLGNWTLDAHRGCGNWSAQMFKLFDLDPATGTPDAVAFLQRVHPDDRAQVAAALDAMAADGDPQMGLFRSDPACGELRWLRPTWHCVRTPDGSVQRYEGTLQDVTAEVHAEASRREGQRRFATLATSAPVGIFETDCEGHCIYVNPRWCEIAGMPAEDAYGEGWAGAIDAEDRPRVLHSWCAAVREAGTFREQYRFRRPDGTHTWVWGQAAALRDTDGAIRGHIGVVTDLTERMQIEVELREALAEARRFRDSLDHLSANVYMKDAQSRYVYANQATLKLFGCTDREISGRDDSSFYPPATVARLRAADARVFAGEQTSDEVEISDAGGTSRTFLEVKAPIYANGETGRQLWGLVGIASDITTRKRDETELAAQLDELRRMHRATLGREERVLALKDEVNALLRAAGRPSRYPSADEPKQVQR